MDIGAGVLFSAAVTCVGAVVWLVRLEGRVNLADQRHTDMKATMEEIRGDVKVLLRRHE